MSYQIDKIAVQMSRKPAELVELEAIDRQQQRFFWLSLGTIVVSFAHMVGALALFSDGSVIGKIVAGLMTLLVDGATWVITGYYDYAKRRQLKRGKLVALLLGVALVISFGLNLIYLVTHMPSTIPTWIGWCIAIAFALFIPLCIAVASAERGQLEDDKIGLQITPQTVNVDSQPAHESVDTPLLIEHDPDQSQTLEPSTTFDKRAAEWSTMNAQGLSYQQISDLLGGEPSRQHIGRHVKRYRETVSTSLG
ncbi:hypothetical protein [Herpetosiphon sp. NSE202]|uniref:hypothetical protein n=1 Tax=Herpetosiphon sp. NSE202 TaxID=3351349 RepID=UPI00362C0840